MRRQKIAPFHERRNEHKRGGNGSFEVRVRAILRKISKEEAKWF